MLMLTDVLYPDTVGGAGRVAHHLGLELSKRGHEIHILTRNPGGLLPAHQRSSASLYVHRFNMPQKGSLGFFLAEIVNGYRTQWRLATRFDHNLICIHQCLPAIGPYLSGAFRDVPSVYVYHSPWHREYISKTENAGMSDKIRTRLVALLMRQAEGWIFSKSSIGIVLSRYMGNSLADTHPLNTTPVNILPGGVDLDYFHLPPSGKAKPRHELALPMNKTVFITVRNLVPRMGIENLIEAFSRSSVLKNSSILLIGGRGPLEDHLKTLVTHQRLGGSIRLLGRIDDNRLPMFYQAADHFVLPTVELEGFGLVILEAMACGTPVLGTPVGAIPEILGRFDKRLLFKGTDWKDIKEKLELVIEHPNQYKFDPKQCRKFIEKNYSWKKMADEFEKKALELVK